MYTVEWYPAKSDRMCKSSPHPPGCSSGPAITLAHLYGCYVHEEVIALSKNQYLVKCPLDSIRARTPGGDTCVGALFGHEQQCAGSKRVFTVVDHPCSVPVRAWMEERAEAAESAARRAAQEPEQNVHETARSELTLREAESARARAPHESFLLFRAPTAGLS